jgi:hypothetical protein
VDKNGEIKHEPKLVVDRGMPMKRGRAVIKVLVRWKGALAEDNT